MKRDEIVKAAYQYRDALIAYAFALLRNWAQAEDAVQDCFIVVMNKWEQFRPGTSLFDWMRQILKYKALESWRSRERTVSAIDEELLSEVAGTVDRHMGEECADRLKLMRAALQQCMSFVNHQGVEILAAFYGESRSCESIASVQKRSVNAIRLALSRMRKQLHDCMVRRLQAQEFKA